jgi:hypothetical protein
MGGGGGGEREKFLQGPFERTCTAVIERWYAARRNYHQFTEEEPPLSIRPSATAAFPSRKRAPQVGSTCRSRTCVQAQGTSQPGVF